MTGAAANRTSDIARQRRFMGDLPLYCSVLECGHAATSRASLTSLAELRELGCVAQSVDARSAMTAAPSQRYNRASDDNERSLFKIRTGSSELSPSGHLMPLLFDGTSRSSEVG
jgi:hypothetical protein